MTPSVDKQASHFVHIPGLSYSGVKSPTECQQSLFESHFASRQSLSDYNLIQRNQSAAFSSGKVRPNHETNINIIARRTGKDVNSHTVLDGIITTIMATIQRINIIGSREGSRNRRRLKANQTGKKFR